MALASMDIISGRPLARTFTIPINPLDAPCRLPMVPPSSTKSPDWDLELVTFMSSGTSIVYTSPRLESYWAWREPEKSDREK